MTAKGVAIITGASRGIGSCVAEGLALDGYKTILMARNTDKLQSVSQAIASRVPKALEPEYNALDLTSHQEVQALTESIQARHGPISVLVNNAGAWVGGTLDASPEDFTRLLDINLVSPFVLMKAVGQAMKQNGQGHIFNIASRAGKYGFPDSGLYSASKFGLVGLSEALYREFSACGIKVTAICPGWVNTDMAREAGASVAGEEMIQPSDVLASIRYILGLSGPACIRELVIECSKSIL
jgi:short-subunit dehydrogenase